MFTTHTESIVPGSGVTTSIIPMVDARPPNVLTYATLVYAAWWASVETFDPSASWNSAAQALMIVVYLDWVLVGKITMVPSNSSALTSRQHVLTCVISWLFVQKSIKAVKVEMLTMRVRRSKDIMMKRHKTHTSSSIEPQPRSRSAVPSAT